MSNKSNYNYEVMPFGLKIVRATYQRLMDMMFTSQIRRNLEVYVYDMVIKTPEEKSHVRDIEETLKSIRKFDTRLNPDKCTSIVQAGKFLGFMLTLLGIEENPHKCQVSINMRNPTLVK